jgi:hypothetical protein
MPIMTQEMELRGPRHPSPNLGALAIVYAVLFCAGLYPVMGIGGGAHFPRPWESAQAIAAYFQLHSKAALLCAFLHFGSAVPLGIFTATIVSRLRFLGVRAAGATIALYGGFAASFAVASGSIVLWVMARPGVADSVSLTQALYSLGFGLDGVGYAVPLALLMAGVSVTGLFYRLVPKWIAIFGLVLAVFGVLSWFSIEFQPAMFFIPLTRLPGFVWMIAVGFALPKMVRSPVRQSAS